MGHIFLTAPIFLNCFSRGGSNLLWNTLLSHPQACSPIQETLYIFRADWRRPTPTGLKFALISGQLRFFDQWNLRARRRLNRRAAVFVDMTFRKWKMKTLTDIDMRFKAEGVVYGRDEIAACRVVAKHNNGLCFLTDPLLSIYPDATFFALVRHPVALYESHRRRGITSGPRAFVAFFNAVGSKMAADSARLPCCHLLHFEDLIEDPWGQAKVLHGLAGLNPDRLTKLRFKAKGHFRADGSYGSDLEEGRHHWMSQAETCGFFERSINRIQEQRVPLDEQQFVLDGTAEVRSVLGYD